MFISIGHSDRTLDSFLALLSGAGVGLVVDVRKLAGSRRFPQFNADALAGSLAKHGVGYVHLDELTGRRPRSHTVPLATNALWQNQSFHNYADHALSPEFTADLSRLRELGLNLAQRQNEGGSPAGEPGSRRKGPETAGRHVAIMCAEAVWWRCHRRIIVDHLLAHGEQVAHVITDPEPKPATLTPGARVAAGTVTYPAA